MDHPLYILKENDTHLVIHDGVEVITRDLLFRTLRSSVGELTLNRNLRDSITKVTLGKDLKEMLNPLP